MPILLTNAVGPMTMKTVKTSKKKMFLKPAMVGLTIILTACSSGSDTKQIEQGREIVKANCFVCHGQGINGAPIIGNIKMWGERVKQGKETLVSHAIEGYNMMPPRGGKQELTDEQITLAVVYMLSELE